MKYLLLLTLCLCLLWACQSPSTSEPTTNTTNQTAPPKVTAENPPSTQQAAAPEDPIKSIRSRFKATMAGIKDGSLSKTTLIFECDQFPIDGEVNYYSNAEGVVQMIEDNYVLGDHEGKTLQYFLDEGKVYFQYMTIGSWVFGEGNTTIDNIEEYRYYIADDKLIRCLKKAYQVSSDNKTTTPKAKNEPTDCPDLATIQQNIHQLQMLRNPSNPSSTLIRCPDE